MAKVKPERAIVDLESVAAAGHNLRDAAFNRLVTASGHYVKFYTAPGQSVDKQSKEFVVGLLELSGNRAILVVRGSSDGSFQENTNELKVSGRLYPHQTEDHARGTKSALSRLDPALVAGTNGLEIFDGYVVATSETQNGVALPGTRIPAPQLISRVGGFYWQHIAYVVTWWFMGILVLFAPFYNRIKERKPE